MKRRLASDIDTIAAALHAQWCHRFAGNLTPWPDLTDRERNVWRTLAALPTAKG